MKIFLKKYWRFIIPLFIIIIFSLFGRFASAFTEGDIQALFLLELDCSEYFGATELTLFGADYKPTFQQGKWLNSMRVYGNGNTTRPSGCVGDDINYTIKNEQEFSFSFWYKLNTVPDVLGTIISHSHYPCVGNCTSNFFIIDRKPKFNFGMSILPFNENSWTSQDNIFTDTNWHQYICSGVWGNVPNTLHCYKDGQEFFGSWNDSSAHDVVETDDRLILNALAIWNGSLAYSSNGDIDEMILFKKILNADERASLQTASILDLLVPPPPEAWLLLQNPAENSFYSEQPIYFNYTYGNPDYQYDFAIFQIINTLTAQVIFRARGIYETWPIIFLGRGDFENILGDGPWKWQGWLWDSSTGDYTEATDWINFRVGLETEWQEDICEGIATTTISGSIECGFRKIINWAFVPKKTSLAKFSDNFIGLITAFPFNVVYDLTDTINEALNATTTLDNTLGIPFLKETETGSEYYILPVLASTSMPNLIGQDNTALFRKSIGWIMIVITSFFIFLQVFYF